MPIHSHTPSHRIKADRGEVFWVLILALTCAVAGANLAAKEKPPVQYKITVPAPPDFSALDWLQGEWVGKTVPNSSPGNVHLSVSPDLDRHFLVFRGAVSLAATPTAPASKESWMGVLSAGSAASEFVLHMFSSTGFISRYRLTTSADQIRLNPEGGDSPPPGWLFRMVWTRTGPDEFTETVQAAPPSKPFFDYFTAQLARVHAAPKSEPGH